MSKINFIDHVVAGGVGGICNVATGHPFDTIKVRLQTMPNSLSTSPSINSSEQIFIGALDCVKKTIKNEGFLALYKGMITPLLAVTPLYAVFFGGCYIGRWLQQTHPNEKLTFIQNFKTGSFAGIFTSILVVPSERIKCILQVQSINGGNTIAMKKYSGPLDALKKLYKDGGIRNIYRGLSATWMRDVPSCGIYLSVYEYLKQRFAKTKNDDSPSLSPFASLAAGGFAGMTKWSICIPADVIKSRLQTSPKSKYPNGIRSVIKEILHHEGPTGFYRGFAPVMLRAFPANAACFLGVEITLDIIRTL